MITESKIIDIRDLPEDVLTSSAEEPQDGLVSLETVEHRHVLRVLETLGGNKNRAAEVLGISRATLYAVLERIGAAQKQAL
jgi:transcriptional regulator with PAS, ATPase and Fis domain